jgi:tripartite-type tricarboxylate transporter receptor subunit TctC
MRAVRFVVLLFVLVCGPLLTAAAAADKYPARPIKFVVGFLAGGPTDTTARIFCEWLSQHLGTCVVENKVGQGGMIAAASVANAPPDGYTILFIGPNNFIGPTLYKNLSFNHVRDTVPVAGLARLSNVMVVPPTLPVKTVAEFIAYAKANPGKISYASSGNGTSVHMSAELFKMMTKLDMVHVPYKGSAGIYPDLLTGKVDVLFDNLPGVLEFSRSGKLRALAVTTTKRQPSLPDVPTVAETVPGYEATVIYGVAASKGTPPEAVQILNKAFNDALADPKVQKRLADLGSEPLPMTSAEFAKLTNDEIEKWAKVVKAANLSIE